MALPSKTRQKTERLQTNLLKVFKHRSDKRKLCDDIVAEVCRPVVTAQNAAVLAL